jgi:hypothetical protein
MSSFTSKLRMNSIYGGGSSIPSPKKLKYMSKGDPLHEIINLALSLENRGNNEIPVNTEPRLSNLERIGQKLGFQDNTNSNKPNVIYKEPLTPFQRESLSLRDRSLDLTESRNKANQELSVTRNNLSAERNKIAEFKAKNPNMRIVASRGGNFMGVNPQTGETTDLGIPVGNLSERDRLELTQDNAVERLTLSDEMRRALAETMHGYRLTEIGARGDEARQTKVTAPGINPKPENASQTRIRQINAARELINTRPELAPFIKLDDKGFVLTTPNPDAFFKGNKGPTPEQYEEIRKFIYEKSNELPKTETDKVETTKETKPENETVIVEKDGKKFKLPKNQLQDAISQGYKQVG